MWKKYPYVGASFILLFKILPIREAYFLCTFTFDLVVTLDLLEWQQAVDSGR